MKLVYTFTLAALSIAETALAEQNSCNFSRYKACIESATVDLSADCNPSRGGVVGVTCDTANRTGSCVVTEGDDTVYVRYYQGFPVDAEQNCAENNGTYIPG